MIDVIATIRVKEGRFDEFLAIFKALVPQVLAEDGCIDYYPAVDADSGLEVQQKNPGGIAVVEKWESVEALQAHLKAPHMLSYREKVADMVEGVTLKVLRKA